MEVIIYVLYKKANRSTGHESLLQEIEEKDVLLFYGKKAVLRQRDKEPYEKLGETHSALGEIINQESCGG